MIATKPRLGSITVQLEAGAVEVPERVRRSLAAFRAWTQDNDLPEKTRVDFHKGKVWVDMGKEQIFSHGLLKTQIAFVLTGLVQELELGYYFCNGVLVTNEAADLSGNPDGTFVSHESLKSGRVELVEGKEDGFTELLGTADMVLEVVSQSSVSKDNVDLREAYWEAGVPEYWLADARNERCEFQILKRGPKGYIESRKVGGWVKSAAFDRHFKLTRHTDRSGNPVFKLGVK